MNHKTYFHHTNLIINQLYTNKEAISVLVRSVDKVIALAETEADLDRADILCSLGQTVLVSNYQQYYKLLDYFSQFTNKRMGIILGVPNLKQIFEDKYYRHLSGGILEAFGRMFNRDLKIYLYPYQKQKGGELTTSNNLQIHPRFRPLYDYLIYNNRIVDIQFDPKVLHIFSPIVLRMIKNGINGWEDLVPPYVDNVIKDKKLFGYKKTITSKEEV